MAPSARSASNCGTSSRVAGSMSAPLLLDADRQVLGGLEELACGVQIDQASGQVEVERVQEVDRRARGVDRHLGRDLQQRLGVVEDDLHAGVDQLVGELLGGGGRDGEDADDDVLLVDDRLQVVGMADQRGADLLADLRRVRVEDRDDAEAVVGEDVARGDRLAEVAGAEQRDVVLAARAQDLADLARPASRRCSRRRACRTCRSRRGRAGSASSSRACTRRAPGRRSSPCPSCGPGSGPAGSARGGRPRRARGGRTEGPSPPSPCCAPPPPVLVATSPKLIRPHDRECARTRAVLVDEVVEQLLPVERDHGDPLEVARVQRVVGLDVDLLERERRARSGRARATSRASSHRWQPGPP